MTPYQILLQMNDPEEPLDPATVRQKLFQYFYMKSGNRDMAAAMVDNWINAVAQYSDSLSKLPPSMLEEATNSLNQGLGTQGWTPEGVPGTPGGPRPQDPGQTGGGYGPDAPKTSDIDLSRLSNRDGRYYDANEKEIVWDGAQWKLGTGTGATTPLPTGGGTTGTLPAASTPASLVGATDEDLFAEFSPEMNYQRWLIEQPQYQKGSGFLRGTARGMRPELEKRWALSQAANPTAFTRDPETNEPVPGEDWLSFISGPGAGRPTQQAARGSLTNILAALEQPEGGNDPFAIQMQGQFGPEGTGFGREGEGGSDALRDLIIEIGAMNLPQFARSGFQRGAQQRFQNQFLRQPGGRVQDWARQWGLI